MIEPSIARFGGSIPDRMRSRGAIELLAASTGGNAIRQSERFNRHLRDLRTLTQHAYLSADHYEDVGAIALGQPPRWGFLQF